MIRAEPRIIGAAVAVFVALAGLAGLIRGLLFDRTDFVHYGATALIGGVVCFVLLLNPTGKADS
ncbi:DUF2964 family protein [Paraburkholderia sp. RL17-337-BIB-A]|uniref:DUF2964 family protein n=1 Tax=Paraburkholderia sp. RL17-337-BIB-A TaxID=3031636 RepID=UPI0038BD2C3E